VLDLTSISATSASRTARDLALPARLEEGVWLRRLLVSTGDEPEAGAVLALASTDPDEKLEACPRARRGSQQPASSGMRHPAF